MKKCIVYPIGDPSKNIGKNSYINDMIDALENKGFNVINKSEFSKYGVISIFKYLFIAEQFIFNWTENIPFRRYGKIQIFFLFILFNLLRFSNKKITFVYHNKYPHNGKNILSELCSLFSVAYATKIISHTNEGVDWIKMKYRFLSKNKILFVNHPVYSSDYVEFDNEEQCLYDYIIWGAISPYKGLSLFLSSLSHNIDFQKKEILICGKAINKGFLDDIINLKTSNITIKEGFISEVDLKNYIGKSRCILFVYSSETVLSSGALIKSLNYNRPIIGPKVGAFKDLENLKLIRCFDNFHDIPKIDLNFNSNERISFIRKNTWNNLINQFV
jgi:hypothetical protein